MGTKTSKRWQHLCNVSGPMCYKHRNSNTLITQYCPSISLPLVFEGRCLKDAFFCTFIFNVHKMLFYLFIWKGKLPQEGCKWRVTDLRHNRVYSVLQNEVKCQCESRYKWDQLAEQSLRKRVQWLRKLPQICSPSRFVAFNRDCWLTHDIRRHLSSFPILHIGLMSRASCEVPLHLCDLHGDSMHAHSHYRAWHAATACSPAEFLCLFVIY